MTAEERQQSKTRGVLGHGCDVEAGRGDSWSVSKRRRFTSSFLLKGPWNRGLHPLCVKSRFMALWAPKPCSNADSREKLLTLSPSSFSAQPGIQAVASRGSWMLCLGCRLDPRCARMTLNQRQHSVRGINRPHPNPLPHCGRGSPASAASVGEDDTKKPAKRRAFQVMQKRITSANL